MAALDNAPNGVSQQSNSFDSAIVDLAQQLKNLRSDVMAGTHPRIKVPKDLIDGNASLYHEISVASMPAASLANGANLPAVAPNVFPNTLSAKSSPVQKQLKPSSVSSGIDTGSAIVPQAEVVTDIRQRRELLERALEEQLQQKRAIARQKTCDQEIVADFDVDEVLRKAQELVKPFKPPLQNKAANQDASSSDSFDENTFYSSQMNESTTTDEAENSRPRRRPLRPCRFFRDGKPCPYGEKCTFSHDPAVVKRSEADQSQRSGVASNGRGNEQSSRRNIFPSDAPPRAPPAHLAARESSAQDPQVTRIAELEEQLRRMKEEQQGKNVVVPRAIRREERQTQEQQAPSPPDADEFGRDLNIRNVETRHPMILRQPSPPQVREYRVPNETRVSPLLNNVRVVRNHITSPYAPQPARVSPLAVTKLPQALQIQRNHTEMHRESRGSNAEVVSAGQSPNISTQAVSSRKRRRRAEPEEQARNVAPRVGNAGSPTVRIKEEPVSPPPYNDTLDVRQVRQAPEHSRPAYIDTVVPRPQERIVYRPSETEDMEPGYEDQKRRPITPTGRRIVSQNGQRYFANGDPDLRRVVSARQMRAPASPAVYDVQYSDTQPSPVRAASQVQYISPIERPPQGQYRASVQPQDRGRLLSPQPRQVPVSPTRRASVAMPPPSRRIVVDQFGNRLMEAPISSERGASVISSRRPIELDYEYEKASPRHAVIQPSQSVMIDEESEYVHRPASSTSPQYIEYPTVSRRRQLVQLGEDPYGNKARILYEPRPVAGYGDMDSTRESTARIRSVRPVDDNYDILPREQVTRVSSVRPQQPRIISLGEHRELTPKIVRQLSVRPEGSFAKPLQRVQRMEEEPMYQYAPVEEEGRYVEMFQGDGMYEQPGRGGRRMV